MIKQLIAGGALAALVVAHAAPAVAEDGDMRKIGSALEYVYKQSQAQPPAAARAQAPRDMSLMGRAGPAGEIAVAMVSSDGYVSVDAVAIDDAESLAVTIEALGGRNVAHVGRIVSAQVPADRLADLAGSQYLAFARPVMAERNVGLVTSQGDRSMRTDEVRADLGFDGTGLTIGVLSDSFSCEPGSLAGGPFTTTAEDIANGDLPADITILEDFLDVAQCIDEGRGMAQLIHDVAPGAAIAFHTAFGGEANFAQGILDLAEAGSDVIVDDIIYLSEPMFLDGIVAQAADEAARLGIPYYSSNGNRARDAYQDDFRPVNATLDDLTGVWHDFDPGPGVDLQQSLTLTGLQTNLSFQWDEPFFSVSGPPGSASDLDVILFDAAGNRVPDCFEFLDENGFFPDLCQFFFTDEAGAPIDGAVGGDAVDAASLVSFIPGTEVQIGVFVDAGTAPNLIKYVRFSGPSTVNEFDTQTPSGFGHNNAAGAEGVGAAAFYFTEEFIGDPATLQLRAQAGEPECVPACLNDFSSAGGTPILFNTDGERLATPEIRLKPGVTGPDGTNTSFFFNDTSRDDDDGDMVFETGEPGEFPNFFGTSASAPHVATVAALLIDSEGSEIKKTRRNGREVFRMCRPERDDDDDDDEEGEERDDGDTRFVRPERVANKIARGWLLGPCSRTEPADIYDVIRSTAQDMSVRADNGTGATLQVFDEGVVPGAPGFDFDSGFGFVDAVAALDAFTDDDDDDDDDDD